MTPPSNSIESPRRSLRPMLLAIVAIGALAPLVIHWLVLGHVPTVTPDRAKGMLRQSGGSAVLVDVRSAESFARRHIDGATSWPLAQILALSSADEMPGRLKGKTLLLICHVGFDSAEAAEHLVKLGFEKTYNVRGGELDWIGSAPGHDGGRYDRWITASGEIRQFPFRVSTWYEQLAVVTSGFGFKAVYTLLSLVLAIILWRNRAPDMVALRWAMVFFFLGENACTANYFVFRETAYFLEYLHSVGMLLCFGFTVYAIVEGMDRRIFMVSEPDRKCASLSLCDGCVKHADVPCGLKRTFYLIIVALIVLSLAPLCSPWHDVSYNTSVYGTAYHLGHSRVHQAFELRYCPIAAIVLLSASLLVLLVKKDDPMPPAKLLFAAGVGPLGFGYLRMILVAAYADNKVWFNFWEEATELLFIAGVCAVLWIFRAALLTRRLRDSTAT